MGRIEPKDWLNVFPGLAINDIPDCCLPHPEPTRYFMGRHAPRMQTSNLYNL